MGDDPPSVIRADPRNWHHSAVRRPSPGPADDNRADCTDPGVEESDVGEIQFAVEDHQAHGCAVDSHRLHRPDRGNDSDWNRTVRLYSGDGRNGL